MMQEDSSSQELNQEKQDPDTQEISNTSQAKPVIPTRDEVLARIMTAHQEAGQDPEAAKEMLEAFGF